MTHPCLGSIGRQRVLEWSTAAACAALGGVVWSGSTVLALLSLVMTAAVAQAATRRVTRAVEMPRWLGWSSDLLWASMVVGAGDLLTALYTTAPHARAVEATINLAAAVGVVGAGAGWVTGLAAAIWKEPRAGSAAGLDRGRS